MKGYEFLPYKGKRVEILMYSDAKYEGILSGINLKKEKICITKLVVYRKIENEYIVCCVSKNKPVRNFDFAKIANIKEIIWRGFLLLLVFQSCFLVVCV